MFGVSFGKIVRVAEVSSAELGIRRLSASPVTLTPEESVPMFDSLRKGVSRATFEAERMMRLNRAEALVVSLKTKRAENLTELGQQAFLAYKRGELTHPRLAVTCANLLAVEQQLSSAEGDAEQIRHERFAPQDLATSGHLCPKCRSRLPTEAVFCPRCGVAAIDVELPVPTAIACKSCRLPVPPGAAFCPGCGTPISSPVAAQRSPTLEAAGGSAASEEPQERFVPSGETRPTDSTVKTLTSVGNPPDAVADEPTLFERKQKVTRDVLCPNCGFELPGEATYCPKCGNRRA